MGKMRSEQFKLRQMVYGDKLDAAAIADQQKKVDDLRREILKSRVEARNQIAAVLTPEQRQQFRRFGDGGYRTPKKPASCAKTRFGGGSML